MAAELPERLRLGRKARIKQGRDFSRIRLEGQRLASGCVAVNWQRLSPGAQTRLGVIVGGKIGNAVARSRVRRLLRETFRVHQHDLAGPVDLVLVARSSIVRKKFPDVENDIVTALRKAGLLKEGPRQSL